MQLEGAARGEKYPVGAHHTSGTFCLVFTLFILYDSAFLLQVPTEGLKGEEVRETQYLFFYCKDI